MGSIRHAYFLYIKILPRAVKAAVTIEKSRPEIRAYPQKNSVRKFTEQVMYQCLTLYLSMGEEKKQNETHLATITKSFVE